MKHTVVITAAIPALAREILAGEHDVIEHPTEHDRTEEDMIAILAEADGAITLLSDPITRRVLESNANLRIVANYAAGYNNIDVGAARELGITVTNTPGVLTETTADLAMALILATTRRLVEGDEEVRRTLRCEWSPLGHLGTSLQGKRLGIFGMGRIGEAVARRARAFGLQLAYTARTKHGGIESETGAARVSFEELLAGSDIISIHAPLTQETQRLFGSTTLGRMKQGSYLINTARGPIVDEEALCDALERGHLRGAGLDVYELEPVVNPRLRALRQVVILPHIGSATEEARTAMARIAATNVRLVLGGREPLHEVK